MTTAQATETLRYLHSHYSSALKDNLDFSHKYLNFYVGINSGLLAGTLAGLLNVPRNDRRTLLLVAGPLLVIVLSVLGFLMVRVFYRRHVEAWVTVVNIERMLKLNDSASLVKEGLGEPRYESSSGGFIAQFERARVFQILQEADRSGASAEAVVARVTAIGDTLRYAAVTFGLFAAIALVFMVASAVRTFG